MVDARQRDNWSHTSMLLALTANCNRDPKKSKPFKPDDFNPFSNAKRSSQQVDIAEMRALFMGKNKK